VTKADVFVTVVRYGYGQFHEKVIRVEESHGIGKYGQDPFGFLDFGFDLFSQSYYYGGCAREFAVGYGVADFFCIFGEIGRDKSLQR
jgi:hypothetical protein